jgi:hypothetical protein
MKLVIILLAVVGGFIIVGMTIAPSQPSVRDWYISNACPVLDNLSTKAPSA